MFVCFYEDNRKRRWEFLSRKNEGEEQLENNQACGKVGEESLKNPSALSQSLLLSLEGKNKPNTEHSLQQPQLTCLHVGSLSKFKPICMS